jgi:hypothetical protein
MDNLSSWYDDYRALVGPVIRQRGGLWRPSKVWLEQSEENWVVRFATPEKPSGWPYAWGWREAETSDGLLSAFTRITTNSHVEEFASKWGPLWLCNTHYTPALGSTCLAGLGMQQQRGWHWLNSGGCEWLPSEAVDAWLVEARRVRGALAVIHALRRDPPEPASPSAWRDFGFNEDQAEDLASDPHLFEARFQLSTLINTYLVADPRGPRLVLHDDLQLHFELGLGPLRAVWLLVAQVAAQQRAIYLCSGCGALYIRRSDLRRPRSGQANYCDDCREDGRYRVAKRLSKRRRQTT